MNSIPAASGEITQPSLHMQTNLLRPLSEAVCYEAAVGGDDHPVHIRRVYLVLLQVLVRAVEVTRLTLVMITDSTTSWNIKKSSNFLKNAF